MTRIPAVLFAIILWGCASTQEKQETKSDVDPHLAELFAIIKERFHPFVRVCGDSWILPLDERRGQSYLELKGVTFMPDPDPLTPADTANETTWKGRVYLTVTMYRTYNRDLRFWNPWKDPETTLTPPYRKTVPYLRNNSEVFEARRFRGNWMIKDSLPIQKPTITFTCDNEPYPIDEEVGRETSIHMVTVGRGWLGPFPRYRTPHQRRYSPVTSGRL